MSTAQVAVEIVIHDARPAMRSLRKNPVAVSEARSALLVACTSAAGVAECVATSDGESRADAIAVISFQQDGSVHIEVGSRRASEERWAVRDIRFQDADGAMERFRAAGYATGTLAAEVLRRTRATEESSEPSAPSAAPGADAREGERGAGPEQGVRRDTDDTTPTRSGSTTSAEAKTAAENHPAAAEADEADEADEVTSHETAPEQPLAPLVWAFDGGVLVGSSSVSRGARVGGMARATRAFGAPLISAAVSYSAESAPDCDLTLGFLRAFVGVGYRLARGRVGAEPRVGIALERLSASIVEPASGARDDTSRIVGAVAGGIDFTWTFVAPLALVVGGSAEVRTSATDVAVHDRALATIGVLSYEGFAGLRLELR